MKQLSRLTVCVLALGLATVASHQALAQAKLDKIKSTGEIQMGVALEPPYSEVKTDGTLTGADPEVTRAVFAEIGKINLKANVVDWGALIPGLMADRFDAVATGLFIRPERCKAVIFSQPLTCTREALLVRKGNPKKITSYKTLVASNAMFSSVSGAEQKMALDAGMPENRIMIVPDIFGSVELLKSGRVDVLGFPDVTLRHAMTLLPAGEYELVDGLVDQPISCSAAAFAPNQKALRDFFDAGIVKLKQSGKFAEILTKFNFDSKLNESTSRTALCGGEN
ncbi:MAG TPA: ectoine/hydroxyectoine ABC transporter substrate-binding protein EhuB [Pseudolabrys sp.]|nr:ectoine/hydroxyectoine ABC transporter substrate-binding protein EhuB [Pseudolabrys sp.]